MVIVLPTTAGGTRLGPRLAVVAIARQGPADGDDQAGVASMTTWWLVE